MRVLITTSRDIPANENAENIQFPEFQVLTAVVDHYLSSKILQRN